MRPQCKATAGCDDNLSTKFNKLSGQTLREKVLPSLVFRRTKRQIQIGQGVDHLHVDPGASLAEQYTYLNCTCRMKHSFLFMTDMAKSLGLLKEPVRSAIRPRGPGN